MYCCHSILECCVLFSGVGLSIRSFCFIYSSGAEEDVKRIIQREFKKERKDESKITCTNFENLRRLQTKMLEV